jgi:hypothetical protein
MSRILLRAVVRRALLVSLVIALAVVSVDRIAAQAPSTTLRVTHSVDKTGPTFAELSGWVYNDGAIDAIDVYVNAAAIDGSGKVLAQGIPYVGSVPARGSVPFKARVPVVAGATGYRVGINSFRFGMGRPESP